MYRMCFVLLLAISVFAGGPIVSAAEPDEETTLSRQQADVLLQQLGDRSFKVRKQAARDLRQMGLRAAPVLRQAAASPDLEVRVRAQRLLDDVERLDHERKLQLFLKRPDGQRDPVLPGWNRYRNLVGGDRVAREVFVEMQRAEPSLFQRLNQGGKQLIAAYEARCAELQSDYAYGRDRRAALGSVCTLLFVGSDPSVTVTEQTAATVYNFTHYAEFRNALSAGPESDPERVTKLRKLLGKWIAQPGGIAAFQKTQLAMRHNLREGLVPALEVVNDPVAGYQLQYAILAIGKLGTQDHVPAVEKLFDNRAVLGTSRTSNKAVFTCEVRDVALAVVVHLTEQNPKEYGFKRLRRNSQYLFSPNSAGFRKETKREAAFKRWAEWKATQTTGSSPTVQVSDSRPDGS